MRCSCSEQNLMIRPWVLRVIVGLALIGQACAKEPVRTELARLQKKTGLNLASLYDSEIYSVDFANRKKEDMLPFLGKGGATHGVISPSGTEIAFDYGHLGIIGIDGSGLRQYLGYVFPDRICWSQDRSKVAFDGGGCCAHNLWILDLNSGATEEAVTAPPKLVEPFLTSQCWSPDGKRFVYWLSSPDGEVRIYDTATKNSHKLTAGTVRRGLQMGIGSLFSLMQGFSVTRISRFDLPAMRKRSLSEPEKDMAVFIGRPTHALRPTGAA